ncbi:hypothetical protein [Ancylomarina euxinus]|nr:hypothetical protein [Ancylomarina euxinus]MCZ4694580.1 hypothetical protein [Ancylomarina euxinus]MUP14123.1 hypothetical protein [Ancylomarina euxinus]
MNHEHYRFISWRKSYQFNIKTGFKQNEIFLARSGQKKGSILNIMGEA